MRPSHGAGSSPQQIGLREVVVEQKVFPTPRRGFGLGHISSRNKFHGVRWAVCGQPLKARRSCASIRRSRRLRFLGPTL
jgi:hypothetical protein